MTAACMGGFCRIRESCRNYSSPSSRAAPAERLCERGEDGARLERAVFQSAAGEWRLSASELAFARRMRSSSFASLAGGD